MPSPYFSLCIRTGILLWGVGKCIQTNISNKIVEHLHSLNAQPLKSVTTLYIGMFNHKILLKILTHNLNNITSAILIEGLTDYFHLRRTFTQIHSLDFITHDVTNLIQYHLIQPGLAVVVIGYKLEDPTMYPPPLNDTNFFFFKAWPC